MPENIFLPAYVFIVAMFLCHLLMPMHHGGHHHEDKNSNKEWQ